MPAAAPPASLLQALRSRPPTHLLHELTTQRVLPADVATYLASRPDPFPDPDAPKFARARGFLPPRAVDLGPWEATPLRIVRCHERWPTCPGFVDCAQWAADVRAADPERLTQRGCADPFPAAAVTGGEDAALIAHLRPGGPRSLDLGSTHTASEKVVAALVQGGPQLRSLTMDTSPLAKKILVSLRSDTPLRAALAGLETVVIDDDETAEGGSLDVAAVAALPNLTDLTLQTFLSHDDAAAFIRALGQRGKLRRLVLEGGTLRTFPDDSDEDEADLEAQLEAAPELPVDCITSLEELHVASTLGVSRATISAALRLPLLRTLHFACADPWSVAVEPDMEYSDDGLCTSDDSEESEEAPRTPLFLEDAPPRLEALSLEDVPLTPTDAAAIGAAIVGGSLRRLAFTDCGVSCPWLTACLQHCGPTSRLAYLRLDQRTDIDLVLPLQAATSLASVTRLHLARSQWVSRATLAAVLEVLHAKGSSLEVLRVTHCTRLLMAPRRTGDTDAEVLVPALAHHPRLREVALVMCWASIKKHKRAPGRASSRPLSDLGVTNVVQTLVRGLPATLASLSLTAAPFGNAVVADAVERCPCLTSVSLQGCGGITDSCAAALRSLPLHASRNVAGTAMTNAVAKSLGPWGAAAPGDDDEEGCEDSEEWE